MVRVFAFVLLLSACAAAPQKSLPPVADLGTFESAFATVGEDAVSRSVAHIVSLDGQYGLVVYTHRKDGQVAGVTRTRIGGRAVPHERITITDGVEGAMILQSRDDMAQAARKGVEADLCGPLGCYRIRVPATLYQQVLLE